jgi:hydroxymethylglutaryl-CoA lyase
MNLPSQVHITEVGPRDGLQNEKQQVPAAVKVELCERLLAAGVDHFEATSFVSPKWVPQMADAAEVMAALPRRKGVIVSVLTPNIKGFESALAAGADEVVIFGAASEAFSQRNINCSIAESIERFRPVAEAAKANGLRLRAALSTAFGCPYQGEVPVSAVVDGVERLRDLGCDEIGIADTIGVGTPGQVQRVMEAAARVYPIAQISGHFHDTYGQALANILACLQTGIARFDSSIAGLGGCPYARGATGNVATEDVVYMLHGLGIRTGLDLDRLVDAGQWISGFLGRKSLSRAGNALAARRDREQSEAETSA